MATIQQIFSWFQTGDIPTQDQFQQTFSSLRHKDEKIAIMDVDGLNTALNNKLASTHSNDENAHNSILVKKDSSNLSADDITLWKDKLGVSELPDNVATIDTDAELGNAYKKVAPPDLNKDYALSVAGLPIPIAKTGLEDIVSEDSSLLIEPDTSNIESNVSLFSEEFENYSSTTLSLSFPAIQILGIYDGGLKLNSNEYELIGSSRIEILSVRKYTLIATLPNVIEIQFTHLKTDI